MELSIVLVIISVIIGSALSVGTTRSNIARIEQTEAKLNRIEDALGAYLVLNGRLPCPARGNMQTTDSTFGVEWRNGSNDDCHGDMEPSGATEIFVGVVPVITLNLPDEFMFDGWGRRITYIVDDNFAKLAADFAATNQGRIIVEDLASPTPNERTDSAIMVLISHGDDGEGAWLKGATTASNARFNPSGAALTGGQLKNAHDPGDFDSIDATFAQGSRSSGFDDIVRYKLKWQVVRMAGGIIDSDICELASRTLQSIDYNASPKLGPVGCLDESNPGTYNNECTVRQTQLAQQVSNLCFREF